MGPLSHHLSEQKKDIGQEDGGYPNQWHCSVGHATDRYLVVYNKMSRRALVWGALPPFSFKRTIKQAQGNHVVDIDSCGDVLACAHAKVCR